jgi:hypothetical protein
VAVVRTNQTTLLHLISFSLQEDIVIQVMDLDKAIDIIPQSRHALKEVNNYYSIYRNWGKDINNLCHSSEIHSERLLSIREQLKQKELVPEEFRGYIRANLNQFRENLQRLRKKLEEIRSQPVSVVVGLVEPSRPASRSPITGILRPSQQKHSAKAAELHTGP